MDTESLIIIGNGFDLQAGLKSSYSDFLKSNVAKKSHCVWIDILSHEKISSNTMWGDVESLLDLLLNDQELELSQILFYMNLLAREERVISDEV